MKQNKKQNNEILSTVSADSADYRVCELHSNQADGSEIRPRLLMVVDSFSRELVSLEVIAGDVKAPLLNLG